MRSQHQTLTRLQVDRAEVSEKPKYALTCIAVLATWRVYWGNCL